MIITILRSKKGPNGAKNFTLSQDFLLYPSVLQNLLICFRKLCTLHDKDNRRYRPMGQKKRQLNDYDDVA